jgi:hypothetical protein
MITKKNLDEGRHEIQVFAGSILSEHFNGLRSA